MTTSSTLSNIEIEQLHKIKEDLELNISSTIRMSLKMTDKIDLDKYIDKTELSRKIVHYSISDSLYADIEFLSDFHGVSKSKIIGAAILAFSEKDFFNK